MKNKRVIALLLCLILVASTMMACSGGNNDSGSSSATTADPAGTGTAAETTANEKPYAGQTIRFVTANQPCVENTLQKSLDEFKEKTGINVNMEIMGTDQFTNKVTVELSAKSNTLDLIFLRPLNDLKQFVQNEWLTDLTGYFENDEDFDLDDFFKGAIDSCSYEGKLYGIPFVAESQLVYYRKDIFEEKGITFPKTLDEFMEVAKQLTDKQNGFYGVVGRGKSNACITQFSTFLRAFGGDFNTSTESLMNTPEAVEAINYYGKLLYEYGPPGVINMSWTEAAALFAQGKAAMFFDADAIYSNVVGAENTVLKPEQIGYAVMPAGSAGSTPFYSVAAGMAIPSFSEKKDATAEFIRWALSKEMDIQMMINDKNPGCRQSSWNNAEATASWPADLLQVMVDSREVAVAGDRPNVINVVEARDILSLPILAALQGQDTSEAITKAHNEFQALIDKENKK